MLVDKLFATCQKIPQPPILLAMDTSAYLHSQGWLGTGHALHASGRGITKPILIPLKQNVLGVGKKKHDAHGDQWWARAFDDTLKGINATTNGATGETEAIQLGTGAQALHMAGRVGGRWVGQRGLYGCFVRGEDMGGTLTPEDEDGSSGGGGTKLHSSDMKKRKRKRTEESREQMLAIPKSPKTKKRRQQGSSDSPGSHVVNVVTTLDQEQLGNQETKEQRRQRKRERKARRALECGDPGSAVPDKEEPLTNEDLSKSDKLKRKKRKMSNRRHKACKSG